MKIYDKKNNLLAIVVRNNESDKEKNFITDDDAEFQVATFNLKKDIEIQKHYHPPQKRDINSTSEVIVILDGELTIDIYSGEQELIESVKLTNGDLINMVSGGHGITMNTDTKFVEVKQGPYIDEIDKIRF